MLATSWACWYMQAHRGSTLSEGIMGYFLFFWYLSTWIYLHYLADACIPAPPPSQEYFFKYFLYALLLNLTSKVTNHDSATVLRAPSWAWNRPLSKHLGGFFFQKPKAARSWCYSAEPTLPSVITGCTGASLTYEKGFILVSFHRG